MDCLLLIFIIRRKINQISIHTYTCVCAKTKVALIHTIMSILNTMPYNRKTDICNEVWILYICPSMRKCIKTYIVTLMVSVLPLLASASSIRTISSREGLSNNAILSMYQDSIGHIWIGTTDGLNIWNGHDLELFDPKDGKNFFSGNAIREIWPDNMGCIWTLTYYGAAKISLSSREIVYFGAFGSTPTMTCDEYGSAYVIDSDNTFHFFNDKSKKFVKSDIKFLSDEEVCKRIIYNAGLLYCFTDKHIYIVEIRYDQSVDRLTPTIRFKIECGCQYVSCKTAGASCYIICNECRNLYTFELSTRRLTPYANIGGSIPKQEKVRAILPYNDSLYIGISNSGVFKCIPGDNHLYATPITTSIFSMLNDSHQDIIWVGTDGEGVIRWSLNNIHFEEITYNKLPVSVKMPIRAIYLDKNNTLWCGTKGDGIFTVKRLSPYMSLSEKNVTKLTTSNSSLASDIVYSFAESKDGIWIGSNGPGLNYYSYSDKKIKRVPGSIDINNIHVVCEQNDSTLWIATHGEGTYKCAIHHNNANSPGISIIKKIQFPAPFSDNERIFSIYQQNDSIIWLGSRLSGAACINTSSSTISIVSFPTEKGYAANDIYSMAATSDNLYFATGCGLVNYDISTGECNISSDIPNRTLHGILYDGNGNLWMSSNYGLICLNGKSRRSTTYNHNTGLDIVEYSDGASYRDPQTGALFFGGINGYTVVRNTETYSNDVPTYKPEIHITHHISNNVQKLIKDKSLSMPHNQSSFGIKFSVVDNINFSDYEFFYRIRGLDQDWISNGNNDIVYITNLAAGNHTLEICYFNKANSYTSPVSTLSIKVIPPLYARWWAKLMYVLLAFGVTAYYILKFRKKYVSLKEELMLSRAESSIDPSVLAQIRHIIYENIDNPDLSPAFIADKMCISSRVLYRKLGDAAHLKPQRLIKDTRMNVAAKLLSETKHTVDEIMYMVGYSNRSSFYKNFKECYSATPTEYRSHHSIS